MPEGYKGARVEGALRDGCVRAYNTYRCVMRADTRAAHTHFDSRAMPRTRPGFRVNHTLFQVTPRRGGGEREKKNQGNGAGRYCALRCRLWRLHAQEAGDISETRLSVRAGDNSPTSRHARALVAAVSPGRALCVIAIVSLYANREREWPAGRPACRCVCVRVRER